MSMTYAIYDNTGMKKPGSEELAALNALGVERGPSFARKVVELLIYVTAVNSALVMRTGVALIPLGGGGPILISGLLCLLIIFHSRETLPMSVWFFGGCCLAANMSVLIGQGEMPVIAPAVRNVVTGLFQLVMFCFVAQNRVAQKRMLVFFSLLMIVSVMTGGVVVGKGEGARLKLENIGGAFANANQLSRAVAVLAMALLFWSLRSNKSLRPILWTFAIALVYILLRTLSRGTALGFICAFSLFVFSILSGRGVRMGGAVFICISLVVLSQFTYLFTDPLAGLMRRFGEESIRTKVYSSEVLDDLWNTKFFGVGGEEAVIGGVGITAHNTFLYMHIAFGGITAWIYLFWVMALGVRTARLTFRRDYPLDIRMMVLALFGLFVAGSVFSNSGWAGPGALYAIAVVDKYTSPYSRRRCIQRAASCVTPVWGSGSAPYYVNYPAYGG